MANLEKAVNEFTRISKSMGYNINPPYTGKLETYDFGRDISPEQPDFWKQYGSFLRISNGSFADGCVFYGMSGGEDDAGLIEFNNALNIPDFKDETMTGLMLLVEITLIRFTMIRARVNGKHVTALAQIVYGSHVIVWLNSLRHKLKCWKTVNL